jgi:protein RecA
MWNRLNPELQGAIQHLRRHTVRALHLGKEGKKRLEATLTKTKKAYGEAAIDIVRRMGPTVVPSITTGYPDLDDIFNGQTAKENDKLITIPGSGRGLPRGRVVELFGPESSGKTTLTLEFIAAAQAQGLTCAFIDAEHALDTEYAERIGVDMDELLLSQPDSAEQVLNLNRSLVESDQVDVIVVDSVAALTPQAELEGEAGEQFMGLHARLMSQGLRQLTATLGKHPKACVIFINQTRQKIGVIYGNPETTPGGNALKFYASVRLRITRVGDIKVSSKSVGIKSKVRVVKNKVGMPFREVFLDITGGKGIAATHRTFSRTGSGGGDDD